MEKTDLIPANREPGTMIKMVDAHLIHIRLKKTNFHPKNPNIQSRREIVQILTPEEFQRNEELVSGECNFNSRQVLNWVTVAGFDEARVIHDGRLIDEALKAEIQAYWDSVLKRPRTGEQNLESLASDVRRMKRKLRITN